MKYTIASGLIGAAVLFQQAAMPEEAQAQGYSYQEQMQNIIEMHAGKDPLQQDLYVAIWNDDLDGVRSALDQGAVPNFSMLRMAIQDSSSALMGGAEWHGEPIIGIYELVTQDKYMQNFTRDELSEALYEAAVPGNVPAIERLIAYGADPNKKFDNMRPEMAIGIAASNMNYQIEQGSNWIANAANTVLAFIQGGTTRQAVADSGMRQEVKDRIFGVMDSVGVAPILNDPSAPRP